MSRPRCYRLEALLSKNGLVQIGELALYDSGLVSAADRVFDQGQPIDGFSFGGVCLLRRRIDTPNDLEVFDGQREWRFRYSVLLATWYRVIAFESPHYEAWASWCGPLLAGQLYSAVRACQRFGWDSLRAFVGTPFVILALMRYYLLGVIALIPILLLFLCWELLLKKLGG